MNFVELEIAEFQELELAEKIEVDGGSIWGRALEYALMAYDASTEFIGGWQEGWNAPR
ncbi:hypothetical protein RYH73_11100 [Olivibacter sp. CPCC 100613]|uniref:hypothetical protein n=1 Tax=Olivibacter sp. CPCC 100613 TaxID=3079931 RepID=UPI002FF7CEE6